MSDKQEEDLLKRQILEIMDEDEEQGEEKEDIAEIEEEDKYRRKPRPARKSPAGKKKHHAGKKKHRVLKTVGAVALVLLVLLGLIILTPPGRSILFKSAATFAFHNMNNEDIGKDGTTHVAGARREEYVTNYLIFGIEEFGGARNTDSMMIASINTKDDTLKLTSLLRDSYVEIPGYKSNKLNSAYARGGAKLLIETIELNYKVQIDGYASVDFKSFEKIVDLLGGVDIELGKEEAKYLNTTNYISKKKNRNVKEGMNHLNGNQVMGYVRVRKVKTLGGANNDYGRVIRQQRALKAMFESYTSSKNILKILPNTKEILSNVTTNLTQSQLEQAMADIVENKMTALDTFRIPVDGAFDAPVKYNGISYPIVLDWEKNRIELYKFIFADTEKEAIAALK